MLKKGEHIEGIPVEL